MIQESENPMKVTIFSRTKFYTTMLQVAVLAMGAIALSAPSAKAQDPSAPPPQGQGPRGGRGDMRGHQVEFLTEKLNLTPDQVTQVKAIDADTWKQAKAVREDTTLAEADKRTKMMEMHKASQDKIRALLTPDQQTKFDALQAEMKTRMENRRGQGGPPPPPSTPQL
jgi:Spy/CpxP family protein refolding chaperone